MMNAFRQKPALGQLRSCTALPEYAIFNSRAFPLFGICLHPTCAALCINRNAVVSGMEYRGKLDEQWLSYALGR